MNMYAVISGTITISMTTYISSKWPPLPRVHISQLVHVVINMNNIEYLASRQVMIDLLM